MDSNKVGQTWSVRLFENGNRIFAGQAHDARPRAVRSRSACLANNTAGSDSFRARASNAATGEVCGGGASIG